MPETKNALAELAEVMDKPVDMASIHDRGLVVLNAQQFSAYQKAKRIVSELAKVGDGRWGKDYAGWFYVCRAESRVVETAVGKCLAIAEGTGDGK